MLLPKEVWNSVATIWGKHFSVGSLLAVCYTPLQPTLGIAHTAFRLVRGCLATETFNDTLDAQFLC